MIDPSVVVPAFLKCVLSPTPGGQVGRRTASSDRLPVSLLSSCLDPGRFPSLPFVAVYLIPVEISVVSRRLFVVVVCWFRFREPGAGLKGLALQASSSE